MNFFKKMFSKNTEILDTPQKLAEALGSGYSTDAGVNITASTAMQISTVFSCIKVLAESVGMLPLNIKLKTEQSLGDADDYKLHQLLKFGVNDFQTAQEWKETVVAHLALRGNHYSFINRINGVAHELLPLNPACVTPKLHDDWSVTYEVTYANGTQKTLGSDEVLHIRLFSLDGLNGLSPIAAAKNSLGLAKATEKHGSKLFANAAQPSGGFSTEATLTDDQYKRLKGQLEDYKGEDVHKNLILEGGLKWFQTSMTSDDAQFLDTRKFQRTDICGIFRVPPHMIADLEKATFSNIEQQGLEFVQHTLMPYLLRIEQRINKDLIPVSDRGKYFAKFNTNALLRGDMKARAAFYKELMQSGAISPNEIRKLEDMNPRDGGNIYLTPMNMTTNPASEKSTNE
jgi:HK97 family phage portal protein